MRSPRPSEWAWCWPAIVFGLSIPFAVLGWKPLAWACLVGAFFPCCLIRDAYIRHRYPRDGESS